MTQSKNLMQRCRVTYSCLALVLVAMVIFRSVVAAAAQQGYESPPVLSASKILPSELVAGPRHKVQEQVRNDGYLNIYTIGSKFGQFTAVSTATLRKRVQEISALAAMEQIEKSNEYATAIKEAGLGTLTGMKNLITSPVQTVKGAGSGLGAAFRRAGDAMSGAKRSEAEDSRIKDLIGFSKTKRENAYRLGVDVYTDNKAVQDRLDEISWAGYAGGLTWSAAMAAVPGGAGIAISVSGWNKLLNEIFRDTPPADLRRMNHEKLVKMGVPSEVADLFINNSIYSPRHQTALVNALDQMTGVTNRGTFVNFAALSENANVAFFRQRQAEMYMGYHKKVGPIESFVPIGGLAAARTSSGTLVFNAPLDHLVWTEAMARYITGANQKVSGLSGVTQKQLWVAGTLSPRARQELERLGWEVQERSEARLME